MEIEIKNSLIESANRYLDEKKLYRYTAYNYNNGNPKFVEYLNEDELGEWLYVTAIKKYPSVVLVRSDGNWIVYDDVDGTYQIARKGKKHEISKLKLNKTPDLDNM